jgi:N-methylhydantoinase A
MIDIITIGTGGGSIAWVDQSGRLRVGPRSAGANPGPMCYALGGDEPTLTDANLLLGRLPAHLLGGELPLDVERARAGLERLAGRLNLDTVRLAAGILEIADWNQVNAIRQVTVKKGLDPRDYAMMPFGGSGPLQAGRVALLLGLETTIVPPNPGNVSALGLLAVDLKCDYVGTLVRREGQLDAREVAAIFDRLETEAAEDLAGQAVVHERRRFLRSADLRYFGQGYEVRIDMPAGQIGTDTLGAAIDCFHAAHRRLYGYDYRSDQPVELVNVRVTGVGLIDRPRIGEAPSAPAHAAPMRDVRDVYFDDGFVECPVFDRGSLSSGMSVPGPAIVQEYGSTTVIPPGVSARVDRFGNLLMRAKTRPEAA